MKKLLSLVLSFALLLLPACGEENFPTASEEKEINTKFGVIKEAIPDFEVSQIPETDLFVFEENGLYGYKNSVGEIIIPAEYNVANGFYNGFASVRKDYNIDGVEFVDWKSVNYKGELLDFSVYEYDENIGLWHAQEKEGKYGYVNAEGREIVPIIYDTFAYKYGTGYVSALKENEITEMDLKEGVIKRYEPFDESKSYDEVIDAKDYDLLVCNNMFLVNGERDSCGYEFPFNASLDLTWDIYRDGNKADSTKLNLMTGPYDGVYYLGKDGEAAFDFAVPSFKNPYPTPAAKDANTEKYKGIMDSYLKERGISKTPRTVDNIITGNFLSEDKTSAVIGFRVTDEFMNERWDISWDEKTYKENEAAFFWAMLLVPDVNDLETYEVLDDTVSIQVDAVMYPRVKLMTVADVSNEEGFDVVGLVSMYEGWDTYIKHLPKR